MLYDLLCSFFVLLSANIPLFIIPGTKGYKNSPLKIGVIGMREPDG